MRRFWIVLLAIALMVPSALAQSAAVNVGDWDVDSYAMLLNVETGELYTAQQEWIRINRLDGTSDDAPLFAAMPAVLTTAGSEEDAPLYALMDGQGSCLTDAEYSWLTYYPEDDVVIGQLSDGTQRALSAGGERLLDRDYSLIVPNGQGGWLTAETEKFSYGERWGELTLIAADGTQTATGISADAWSVSGYSCGLCRVAAEDGTFYLDASGREAFRLEKGRDGYNFVDNTAVFRTSDGMYGLLEPSGAEAMPAKFTDLSRIDCGDGSTVLLGVRPDGTVEMYDGVGAELLLSVDMNDGDPEDYYYTTQECPGVFSISNNTLTELYTTSDERLSSNVQDGSTYLYCDYAVVGAGETPQRMARRDGEWPLYESRLIALDGTPVGEAHRWIDPEYWADGHARCVVTDYDVEQVDGEWQEVDDTSREGVIDENGAVILDSVYDTIDILSMDRYWVRMGDDYALLDGSGSALVKLSNYSRLMD